MRVHLTHRGEFVRRKSEAIIANTLYGRGINYRYEQPLSLLDGQTLYPDFTVITGGRKFYWEHLMALAKPEYRERCQFLRAKYRSAGIMPWQEGGGPNGILIETQDKPAGGLHIGMIDVLIKELLLRL